MGSCRTGAGQSGGRDGSNLICWHFLVFRWTAPSNFGSTRKRMICSCSNWRRGWSKWLAGWAPHGLPFGFIQRLIGLHLSYREFFAKPENSLALRLPAKVEVGQYVAGYYQEWTRCQIVQLVTDEEVKVTYNFYRVRCAKWNEGVRLRHTEIDQGAGPWFLTCICPRMHCFDYILIFVGMKSNIMFIYLLVTTPAAHTCPSTKPTPRRLH